MNLKTPRLLIRDWHPIQDAADAFAIYSDARVTQWLGSGQTDQTLADIHARLERYRQRTASGPPGTGAWAIVEQVSRRLVGNVLLVPLPDHEQQPSGLVEIGWHLNPAYWGLGYATEAASAVLKRGFEHVQLPAIYAVTLPNNVRSQAVTQRLGMADLGLSTKYYGGIELRLFCLRAEDWRPL